MINNIKNCIVKTVSVLAIALFTFSCTSKSADINIKGTLKANQERVVLTQINKVIAETKVDASNNFSLAVKDVKSGYYLLNNELIYLAPGFSLNLDYTGDNLKITGNGEKENNTLKSRVKEELNYELLSEDMAKKYEEYELEDYKVFLKELELKLDKTLENSTLNSEFVVSERLRTKALTKAALFNYSTLHGIDMEHPMGKLVEEFLETLTPEQYDDPNIANTIDSLMILDSGDKLPREMMVEIKEATFKDFDFNNETLYSMQSPAYFSLYQQKLNIDSYSLMNKGIEKPLHILNRNIVIDSVNNKAIQLDQLTDITDLLIKTQPDLADEAYAVFKKQSPSAVQLKTIETSYKNLKSIVVGKASPKFTNYKTPEGKNVSLDDLSGKYVYIDIWATWCGPCKKEIPALKELEKEFHDKAIAFVSISLDTEKHTNKWKQMVKDMDLKGVQLIADKDFKSEFIKAYNIISIPRFILIDPKGNVVSGDAPRPTDPELKLVFEALL